MCSDSSCDEGQTDGYTLVIPTMGSQISIRWIPDAELLQEGNSETVEAVEKKLREVNDQWVEILSDYQQDSEVNRFCGEADDLRWHTPGERLWQVIELCDRWNRWSEGAFDAGLGALARLRRGRREYPVEVWEQARMASGWERLELDYTSHRVRFRIKGVRLDFGAIGKGFVVDRLAECLEGVGIRRYVVNASGNMKLGECPRSESTEGWPVTIGCVESPDRSLALLQLQCCGIATSGDLFQKFRDGPRRGQGDATSASGGRNIEGESKTSHIVDPGRKQGLQHAQMASVVTTDATHADAFATALCVHMERGTARRWLTGMESKPDSIPFWAWMQSQEMEHVVPRVVQWRFPETQGNSQRLHSNLGVE